MEENFLDDIQGIEFLDKSSMKQLGGFTLEQIMRLGLIWVGQGAINDDTKYIRAIRYLNAVMVGYRKDYKVTVKDKNEKEIQVPFNQYMEAYKDALENNRTKKEQLASVNVLYHEHLLEMLVLMLEGNVPKKTKLKIGVPQKENKDDNTTMVGEHKDTTQDDNGTIKQEVE